MNINIRVLWIDITKFTKALSNLTFKEDLIFKAHSHESGGLTPYINKHQYDLAVNGLKNTPCTGNGDDHLSSCIKCKTLSILGELDR
jgi:hypothetical protein